MKHRYAITVATTGLAATAAAATLGLTTSASAATVGAIHPRTIVAVRHAARPAAKIPTRVVLDCAGRARVRPSGYVLACADANMGLQAVRWTSWTPAMASGYGTFYENTCTPDCASGHLRRYPALATLWGASAVPGHPADMRYRPPLYAGQGQPVYPLTQTFDTGEGHV
jgi:hypothetical protein